VKALIVFFLDLCLLRRAPQDLPASDTLLGVLVVVDALVGFLVGLIGGVSPLSSLAQSVVEIVLMLTLLLGALSLARHPGRFTQAASALLGAGVLIGLLALPAIAMIPSGGEDSDLAALGTLLLLGFLCWSVLVTGHIVRHTFGLSLGQGIGIAVGYQLLSILTLDALFGAGI
jgi:hypothetical protein